MSDVLSQEEVDALLRGVTDGEIETETEELIDESGVVAYDLTSQERIIRGRMPTLDIINQRFTRLFRNSMSTMLRKVVDVSTVSIDTIKFGEFIKSLPVPASLHVYKMDPLRGFALMVMESKLVFSLVDTFFGGSGTVGMKVEGRDFTTIETKMIKTVVKKALEDQQKAWTPVHPIDCQFIRSEVNPQFAAIVPPTDVVIVVIFEIEMDQVSGSITICLPYSTLEPIIAKLRAGFQSDQLEVDFAWLKRLRERMKEAEVEIIVELGHAMVPGRDIVNFKVGDIITLEADSSSELEVSIEQLVKFKGYPGVFKGSRALQVSQVVPRKESEV